MKDQILSGLSPEYPWRDRFQYIPTVDSTNDRLKALAKQGAPHGTVLVADRQTGGHGRMGRSFHSPEGMGVYLSILLRPRCAPADLMHLTCATAVAMADAVEASAGFRPGIKWTNDLVSGKRKLGGILTGLGLKNDGSLDYAIIGIGINCLQKPEDFPEDIREMAGSLSMIAGRNVDRSRVAAAMMEALWRMDSWLLTDQPRLMARYRSDCITLGQQISLVRGDEVRYGTALDIDDKGGLVVAFSTGETGTVTSGEVSIRGMYGYV